MATYLKGSVVFQTDPIQLSYSITSVVAKKCEEVWLWPMVVTRGRDWKPSYKRQDGLHNCESTVLVIQARGIQEPWLDQFWNGNDTKTGGVGQQTWLWPLSQLKAVRRIAPGNIMESSDQLKMALWKTSRNYKLMRFKMKYESRNPLNKLLYWTRTDQLFGSMGKPHRWNQHPWSWIRTMGFGSGRF